MTLGVFFYENFNSAEDLGSILTPENADGFKVQWTFKNLFRYVLQFISQVPVGDEQAFNRFFFFLFHFVGHPDIQ